MDFQDIVGAMKQAKKRAQMAALAAKACDESPYATIREMAPHYRALDNLWSVWAVRLAQEGHNFGQDSGV